MHSSRSREAALPTLFGRFTAVMGEHEQFEVTLHRLDEICGGPTQPPATAGKREAVRLIGDLHRALSAHFAMEEGDGYFGVVARDCPHLRQGVEALRAEHAALLEALGALREVNVDGAEWTAFASWTARVLRRLREHELRETRLMREFLLGRDHAACS